MTWQFLSYRKMSQLVQLYMGYFCPTPRKGKNKGLLGSVPNLLLIELFLKWIKWLEAYTNIVKTLPVC
jgi:hypothetical protein